MAHSIALIDDDQNILTSLQIALEAEGFRVRTYDDGTKALSDLLARPPNLAILDIKMPRMDGLELLTKLRRHSALPVILLTSKDEEIDELQGLKMGADDYISKPFSLRVLIERVRALLRRDDLTKAATTDAGAAEMIVRDQLVLDMARHLCTWRGEPLALTVTEFLLLTALARRPNHVKSRGQLMDAAYSDQVYVDDRTIDSHIKRLRKKFRDVDPDFTHIETLYGVGYRYVDG